MSFKKLNDMKKTLFLLCFTLCMGLVGKAQTKEIHLTGKIKNYAKQTLRINIEGVWAHLDSPIWEKVKTDANGNFTFSVPFQDYPVRYISLRDSINDVFSLLMIEPQDKIYLAYDFKNFPKTLKVEGNGSWKVEYYREDDRLWRSYYTWMPDMDPMPLEQHLKLCDSLNAIRFKNLEVHKPKMTPTFLQLRYADLAGDVSGRYPNSFDVHQMKFDKEKEKELSKYYDSIYLARNPQHSPQQDPKLVFSRGYTMFASNLIWALANKLGKEVKQDTTLKAHLHRSYHQFKSLLMQPLAEKTIGEYLVSGVGNRWSWATDTLLLADYVHSFPNSLYTPKVKGILKSVRVTQVGMPAYDFELEDIHGKKIKLSSLKGKTILIDFWGTWCGSCKREHPHMKEVAKNLENADFQIVLISFFDNKKNWLEYVKNKELEQPNILNLWSNDVEGNLLQENYNFSSAPHKTLLDKQGNIMKWEDLQFDKETTPQIQQGLEEAIKQK